MTTMRPPGSSPYTEKTVRPIFPPMMNVNGNTNGATISPNLSQMSTQNPPLLQPPIFPPNLQPVQFAAASNTQTNLPKTNGSSTPTLPNINSNITTAQASMQSNMSTNSSTDNRNATPTPISSYPRFTAPLPTLSNQQTFATNNFGQQATVSPAPISFNQQATNPSSTNSLNQQNFQSPPTSNFNQQTTQNSSTNTFYQQPLQNSPINNTFNHQQIQQQQTAPSFNSQPMQAHPTHNLTQHSMQSTTSNSSQFQMPAPPPGNIYNPSSMLSGGTVRPMYPSPTPLYHAPITTQPLPSNLPPPPPPPTTSSTSPMNQNSYSSPANYQYPAYNPNTNTGAATNPTQPPPMFPGNPMLPNVPNQSMNNINGSNSNNDSIDLLKEKSVLSPFSEEPPISPLLTEENQQMNCNPEVMRCSLNVIPKTKELLQKTRLPFGILIHPFRDLESLSVIQGTRIVRCDSCKSYINPFVTFLDNTRWRCSICNRVNDLPQEFLFDPITKTYGDPSRRPEVRFGTVEYTATADYMARPPQPAMYLFLLDVSHNAIQTGYLQSFCDILLESLSLLPGDARTQIGFLSYDSRLHFYDLADRQNAMFRVMVLPEIDQKSEDLLPLPDGLMVTLSESRSIIETFLKELPKIYQDNHETDSALGSALLVAQKLLEHTGGRITVVQTRIPNLNPGALGEMLTSAGGKGKEPSIIAPTSDFYKKLALDYASIQIACDVFLLNSHYVDLATLSCVAKYSGGEMKYYPGYHSVQTPHEVERFENDLRRYFQRKIGFEAVMRLRSPQAMSIHAFHGNGFVRSVDLLVLPNINPDAAFGIQISIDDSLAALNTVTFQAALLYTSSKGERRIRVHTLSLPVSGNISEILSNADQEAAVSLIAKMAADRSMTSSIQEAREAMANVAVDITRACVSSNTSNRAFSLNVPYALRLIPLYMLSMIKSTVFRAANTSKIDDRAYYLEMCKTLPVQYLIQIFYPDLYPIHTIEEKSQLVQDGEDELHIPHRTHLSYQHIDSHGAYILDTSEYIYIYIGKAISDHFVQNVFNVATFSALPYDSYSLPEFENPLSTKIHNFLSFLIQNRSHGVGLHIMREDSSHRYLFTRHLVDDKSESTMSYVEFLRYIREHISK